MLNDYSLWQIKKLIDSIIIDAKYNGIDEFDADYYNRRYLPKEVNELIDPDGFDYLDGLPFDEIWELKINSLNTENFFMRYNSFEKDILDEMILNSKICSDSGEFNAIYSSFNDWINKKSAAIEYDHEIDNFQCEYVTYGDTYNKLAFKDQYHNDIQDFVRILKKKLNQTSSLIVENLPLSGFKSPLVWNKGKIELIELMVALVESGSIHKDNSKVSKEFLALFFSQMFNFDLSDYTKNLYQAKSRKKNPAPYLELLKETFIAFCNKSKVPLKANSSN